MGNFLLNVLWFVTVGWIVSITMFVIGLLFMCTVVGIPLGVVCFKKGQQWALPFGRTPSSAPAPTVHITNIQNRND